MRRPNVTGHHTTFSTAIILSQADSPVADIPVEQETESPDTYDSLISWELLSWVVGTWSASAWSQRGEGENDRRMQAYNQAHRHAQAQPGAIIAEVRNTAYGSSTQMPKLPTLTNEWLKFSEHLLRKWSAARRSLTYFQKI
jgi:hypothetical protein